MKKWKKIMGIALGISSICLIPVVGITSCSSSAQTTISNSNQSNNSKAQPSNNASSTSKNDRNKSQTTNSTKQQATSSVPDNKQLSSTKQAITKNESDSSPIQNKQVAADNNSTNKDQPAKVSSQTSSSTNNDEKQIQSLNDVITYIKNNQSSLFKYLAKNNCVSFSNNKPLYQSNFAACVQTWLQNNSQQLPVVTIINNDGKISASLNNLTSTDSYQFATNGYYDLIQNALDQIVTFALSLTGNSQITNWLVNTKNIKELNHKYQITNLNDYLNAIQSLANFPNSLSLSLDSQSFTNTNLQITNNDISFQLDYFGVTSNTTITFSFDQLNQSIANEAVKYLQNHEENIINNVITFDLVSINNNQTITFQPSFLITLQWWLANHFFNTTYRFNSLSEINSNNNKIYITVGKQNSTNPFAFPTAKFINTVQKILNDLVTFTNDLNDTTNSIANWLLATNNLVNENNSWKIKSVTGYFKQTLVRNLIPTMQTNNQWKDLYPFIYKFFNSNAFIGLSNQKIVNHQLLFSFDLFNLNSTNMVAISLPTKTINDEEQANNVITYLQNHQDAFLAMVIQNGSVTFNNNQLVFANNFDLQVTGWITANFNPFINLSIINNNGAISAQVNAVSSTTTYTFPTSIYQSDLQNIANQIAQLITTQNNNNHSFTSWFYAHYYELLTTKYVVKDKVASLTYVFTNLASYLPKLNLYTIGGFNLPLFSKTIYQFINVNSTNDSLSFNITFAGVSSTKQVKITLPNNNQSTVEILNGIITYLNNHEQEVQSYIANSNGVVMKNNHLIFSNDFIYDLNSFISNNLPAAFGLFSINNNNGIITISTLTNPSISSTTSFDFSLTKFQAVLQSQVNQLAKYINALNTSQLAISKWLVATNNATYNHGQWSLSNLSTYLATISNKLAVFNYFYGACEFANVSQSNNQISFAINLDGVISTNIVTINLNSNDLNNQTQANNLINYLNTHQTELLAGLIGIGRFSASHNEIVLNDAMLNAINNWITSFYDAFINVQLISLNNNIYAKINGITSTLSYSFVVQSLTNMLQNAANQVAINIKNKFLSSLPSWLIAHNDLTNNNGTWTMTNLGSFLNSFLTNGTGVKNGNYTYPLPYHFTNTNCTFSNVIQENNQLTFSISIYGISSTIQLSINIPLQMQS